MERPIITATDRLKLAIQFAQMDLDTLRPGDWLNLRDDLKTFLRCNPAHRGTLEDRGGIVAIPLAHPLPDEFSVDDFRALQKEVDALLQSQVHEGRMGMDMIGFGAYLSVFRPARLDGWPVLALQGATRDMFLVALAFLLWHAPSGHIRRCPEPGCGKIFYRNQKQLYCSRVCANRATVRTWREREDVKAKELERAHQHYLAEKPENTRSKVTRRPRKQLPS